MGMIQDKRESRNRAHPGEDSTSLDVWQQRVEYALKHLGERILFNSSPLAKLAYIQRLATGKYNGHLLPRGLALHDTLITCVARVLSELKSEPGLVKACVYLKLVMSGTKCREISKELGLSREHISRV
jgi:hypothetical protein